MISCSHWGEFTETVCAHPRRTGEGSCGPNGIGSMSWRCPDCGKGEHRSFGPSNQRAAIVDYQRLNFGNLD